MKTNKSAKIVLVTLLAVLLAFTFIFTACGPKESVITLQNLTLPQASQTQMTVVVKNAETGYTAYVVNLYEASDNSKPQDALTLESSVLDVLNYLKDNHSLNFKYSVGEYGAFVEEVGELANDASAGEYIMLYTSIAADFDTSAYVSTYDCGGTEVKTSGFGVSEMSVAYGAVIYIQTIVY